MLLSLITTAFAQDLEGIGSAGSVDDPEQDTTGQAVVGGSQVRAGDWPWLRLADRADRCARRRGEAR